MPFPHKPVCLLQCPLAGISTRHPPLNSHLSPYRKTIISIIIPRRIFRIARQPNLLQTLASLKSRIPYPLQPNIKLHLLKPATFRKSKMLYNFKRIRKHHFLQIFIAIESN